MAKWALVSGESGGETAAVALAAVGRLKAAGVRVAGFVQHKTRNENGEKRYSLERLRTGERLLLAVDGVVPKRPAEEVFCSMAVHNDAFAAARGWLQADAGCADLLLVDSVSKLEASGKGHCAALEDALRLPGGVVLLCVRASQLSWVLERFQLPESAMVAALELPAGEAQLDAFVLDLQESCRARDR